MTDRTKLILSMLATLAMLVFAIYADTSFLFYNAP